MLRELITWVLNTYLGKYLEDFNPAQLSVALLSGEVELENVPIRKDALRSFGLPVQAVSGVIGKIKLQIPVRQFKTAPWCVVIEQVYVVFSPKDPNDWNDDAERFAELQYKMSELDSKEAVWRAQKGYNPTGSFYYATSYTNWLNYGTALATNIVENLELKIRDVHIRYEDSITVPNFNFAAGIKIDSLTVQSCDSKWSLGSKMPTEKDIAYKLIELNNFAVYWDRMTDENCCCNLASKELLERINVLCDSKNHDYVIYPICARAQCKRERCKLPLRTRKRPRLSCTVVVSKVDVSLSNFQYQQILGCISGLQDIKKIRMYKILRPSNEIFGHAKDWWQYAAKCYGFNFEANAEKWHKFRENLRYINIYKRLLLNPSENLSKEEKELKSHVERVRTLTELHVMRNVCFNNADTPDLNLHSQHINQGKSMLFHWFPNWWGWYGSSSSDVNQAQPESIADEEIYQNIEDDILNALEDSVGNNSYLKRDMVFGYFDFKLASGKLSIYEHNFLSSAKTVMEMNFQNLNLMIETRPRSGSHLIGLSMGSVCVVDRLTPDTEFPELIKPQVKEINSLQNSAASNIILKQQFVPKTSGDITSETLIFDPWFQLQYEKRPISYNTDFRLLIKSKSLDIVYNTNALQWSINFFTCPLNVLNTNKRLIERKKTTKPLFFKNWKNLLMENLELRKTWSFEIDISAPQILFVDNFTDKNSCIVLIDFGRFQLLKNCIETKLKEPKVNNTNDKNGSEIDVDIDDDDDMFMTPCSTPPGSESSPLESSTQNFSVSDPSKIVINNETGLESAFHNKIYDKYIIDLTDLQVLICKNRERNFASLKGSSIFHLLDKFSISLQIERRIIHTLDPEYPSLTVFGTLPRLVVHVNDQKINAIMSMLTLISAKSSNETRLSQSDYYLSKKEEELFSSSENITLIHSNLIILQFVIDQMALEVQSQDRSIAELQVIGVRAGLNKRPEETNINLSVHGLLLVDAIQSFGPDFELLVASHRHVGMDSISGSLKQSEPCSPTSPASPDPMAYKRPTSPHIISKAINSLQSGTSTTWAHLEDMEALITVDINYIKETADADPLQIANISFNNLDIIANQETIAELLGFVNRIEFINKRQSCYVAEDKETENEIQTDRQSNNNFQLRTEVSFDFHRLNILILRAVKKENFFVGRKVGTFTMSEAKIHATFGKDISATGSLGGLQILDVTPEGINHQRIFSVGKDPLTDPPELSRKNLLSSLTQEMYGASFKEKDSNQKDALMFKIARNKNCSISIKIRMASVWYTHCARFIQEISWCAFQFKHYFKNFARSIRNKAADMAIEFVQQIDVEANITEDTSNVKPNSKSGKTKRKKRKLGSSIKIKLDIILNSPVLVVPRSSHSSEVLVANLGKISIGNTENENNMQPQTFDKTVCNENVSLLFSYFVDVRNINLFSLDTSRRKELRLSALPRAEEFYSCKSDAVAILHDTAIQLVFSNYSEKPVDLSDDETDNFEFLSIQGSVTQLLKVSLSREQYEQLLESIDNAFKVPNEFISSFTTTSPNPREHALKERESSQNVNDTKCSNEERNACVKSFFSLPLFVITLNNEHNNPLVEITFLEFSINYNIKNNRQIDLQVLLRSVLMEDLKCVIDSRHRHMVDSTPCKEFKSIKKNSYISFSCPDLVSLQNINKYSRSIPDNLQSLDEINVISEVLGNMSNMKANQHIHSEKTYDSPKKNTTEVCNDNLVAYVAQITYPQTTLSNCDRHISSSIDFNSLNLIISVERWSMVLDFFGLLTEKETEDKDEGTFKQASNDDQVKENSDLKMSVRSLNLTFVRNEMELAKANVSNASFVIKKHNDAKIIEGRLGSISLLDLTTYGKLYKEKFLTSGTEALNFHYKRPSQVHIRRSLEKDAMLQIQMSSVRYVHTKRFVMEIQSFIKEFLQVQTPVIRKMKLSDTEKSINDRPPQIGLNIRAASPIILLPLCYESNELIVADLGEFTLINDFYSATDEIVKSKKCNDNPITETIDVMQIDLVKINLFTAERVLKPNKNENDGSNLCFDMGAFSIFKRGNNLLKDKCYLKLQVERNMDSHNSHNFPDVSVNGTLSKVSCLLNLQQYKLVRGFLAHNLGEDIDDIYKNQSSSISESISKINSTLRVHKKKNESSTWNVLSIKMELEDVSVHLNVQLTNRVEAVTLSCINFIKSFLEIDCFSDGAQDIDLVSSEILVTDTRYSKSDSFYDQIPNNVFTEVLKPIKSGSSNIVQAEIHSRRRSDCTKYTILLNNMRIMAILDWMESMKDYLGEQIASPFSETHGHNQIKTKSQLSSEDVDASTYEIILNITDSELVLVEKTNQCDTSAIILKSTTVFSYKPYDLNHPISINLNHLEVFSCIFGFENESALSIIDPVTLNIEVRNNKLDITLQKQLCIRLSYHDVKMFTKMLESIPKQTRTAQAKKTTKKYTNIDVEIIAPLIAMGFNPHDCLYAMEICNYKLNDAAIWLSQQKQVELVSKYLEICSIAVSAQCISICVIDDCKDADVPLLEISLSRLLFVQKLKENCEGVVISSLSYPSGQMEAIIGSDYYNRRLSGWEPVIEPWECMANWKFNADFHSTKKRFISVDIKSKQLLKFNITSTLMELCKLVRNNWTQDYYEGTLQVNTNKTPQFLSNYRRRTPFIPFALRNETGETIRFKIILAQPGGITRTEIVQRDFVNDWINVKSGETVPFSFGLQNKLRHMDSHRLDLHQIIVEINEWTPVGPISIDKVGVFFRYSTAEDYIRRSRIVFDITLVGSAQKLITVRSALRVFNKLSKNITLKMGIQEDKYTCTVKPKEYFSVPLRKIDSLLYIKPSDTPINMESSKETEKKNNTLFGFCNRGISWSNCANDLNQELCVCLGQNNIPFNILVSIRRDKYSNRDILHMPGHTITLYTPLIITNMLCCDLLFKISGHKQGRIHASEKAYIHDVNICDGINISLTIDNYTVYGQLRVPANHTGIVEPKLKLLDVNNRPLYLRTSIQSLSGKGMEIFISAPVWLINKTGLPLIYRQEGVNHIASGQFEENENARYNAPLMFSFSDLDASPSLTIRLGMRYGENNPWCKSFSLHKDIIHRQLQAEDLKGNYTIGIEIRRGRGRYSCTNVVTLSPRFQLYNRSSHELQFAQKCDVYNQDKPISNNKMLTAVPGCHFPFHWPHCDQEPLLCVRLIDIECCQWSSGIPINEAQSHYMNIRNSFGEMLFLRLEVILQGATYFLLFGDAHTLPPPIRIDNYSEVQINFFQHGYKPQWSTSVRPCSSLAYALDDPIGKQSLRIEAPGGNAIDFPLHKVELSTSLTYSNFIYIAFKETFLVTSPSESNSSINEVEIDNQQLVLGVKDKRVIIMKKCTGDRSQLWLMNSSGQLEHEGSSPPVDPGKGFNLSESRMVLDVEKPPDPMNYTNCVIRPPNKQRETTQNWRFENGRLMCHANMCVQARNGVFGLYPGADAVLGRMESESHTLSKNLIPIEQCIERQKLRPGSGHLEVKTLMDGPILTIQIRDVKNKLEDESLHPDPLWKHTSTLAKNSYDSLESQNIDGCLVKLELVKGIGISVISRQPCEELIYLTLQNLTFDFHSTSTTQSFEFKVSDIQIDNELLDTSCPVLLYTAKSNNDKVESSALILNVKILPSLNKNAVIIENLALNLKPYVVILEERLLLKIALFLGFGVVSDLPANIESEYEAHYFENNILSTNSKRYYFENLLIGECQIRLSVLTSTKLSPQLSEIKKSIGLTLIKFEDAVIEFEKFTDKHHFETVDVYLTAIKIHYKNQIKWHAGYILGSVDFLGNPLGFANDLSEGVSGLIFEGSVKSLVKNVTHGISNSTAKLTETLSDSLGRVVLDEQDNEARQKVLEISSGLNTSTEHLTAGLKGLGFGLLGGVTSIVRHTYAGAQTDGLHGFISGFGKGLVGTVTKPLIGVLDLASETASAVRETSKGSHRILPDRKRLPRCVTGAPGGLLPAYSFRQSKGQQYLYIINRRNMSEHLISYEPNLCNEKDAKLRLLVSTEYIRIFSRYDEDTSIVLECHLSEVLSCHPLTANVGNPSSLSKPVSQYYIEISTNLPKITRPRIRCQNEEIAERAARYINYAKSVFDEREQTVVID